VFIDIAAGRVSWRDVYRLCISFIHPRPIALVSTIGPEGVPNLAPFSFYNMVSANPPVVMFCPGLKRDRSAKDTLRNVEATGEFAVASVDESIVRQMVDCAAELPYGHSEFAFSGLTPVPARLVRPPLVEEAPVNIECRLRYIYAVGDGPGSSRVVFGDIVGIHVRDGLLAADGTVDPHRLRTVGRLGGAWYCTVREPYELHIPRVDESGRRVDGAGGGEARGGA